MGERKQVFHKYGICVAVDGSDDEVININGVDDYIVGSSESSSDDDDDDDTSNDPCEESDAEMLLSSIESDSTSNDPFEEDDEKNVVSSSENSDAEDESIEVHSSTSEEEY